MRALVFGSAGQLGRELVVALGSECVWSGDRAEIDVTDARAVSALVTHLRPDVVWNATAWNRVDAAEICFSRRTRSRSSASDLPTCLDKV